MTLGKHVGNLGELDAKAVQRSACLRPQAEESRTDHISVWRLFGWKNVLNMKKSWHARKDEFVSGFNLCSFNTFGLWTHRRRAVSSDPADPGRVSSLEHERSNYTVPPSPLGDRASKWKTGSCSAEAWDGTRLAPPSRTLTWPPGESQSIRLSRRKRKRNVLVVACLFSNPIEMWLKKRRNAFVHPVLDSYIDMKKGRTEKTN